jgi:hypothetical protein
LDERSRREEQISQIQHQRQELEREKQQIAQIKRNIDQQRYNLQELEPFTPLARQLQAMKVDITTFMPWAESVQEYAITHNTDLTTAAFDIVKNLRAWKNLEAVQNAIEKAKKQLVDLNTVTAQKEQALTTLLNLQVAGFSEKEISELIRLVNMWNKQWPGIGSQGNGSSSTNGSKLDDKLIGIGH